MSEHKPVVERYFDGFRRGDHAQVLSCLADDVVWTIHGASTIEGKAAVEQELASGAAFGLPVLVLDDLVEQSETVVAIGHGHLEPPDGERTDFVFSEVFRFRRELVRALDTFHIDLPG
jgi:ketosteroid isomerase-like protein